MNIRRITTMMAMGIAMAVGGVLSVATPAIASPLAAASIIPIATGASTAVATPDSAADASTRITSDAATRSYHEIVNYAYNQCIEAPGGVLNVRLRLAGCNGSSAQKWAFVADSSSGNTYYLVNRVGGFCAEVNNGTSTAGEAVDEYFCNGTRSEQWVQSFRVINGAAYQHFTHAGTDLCLDTVGGSGSQLMQWSCGPENDAQTWLVR